MAYVVLVPVSSNDAVKASYNNQILENLERLRLGEIKKPYGNGSDFIGFKLLVDDGPPVALAWYAKANTEPENITAANAEYRVTFAELDPSSGLPS